MQEIEKRVSSMKSKKILSLYSSLSSSNKKRYISTLSYNSLVTINDIFSHPEIEWDWKGVSWNSSLALEIVFSHPEVEWDWNGLSENPSLTFEEVLVHPDLPWCWKFVRRNPSLTPEIVLSHPEIKWDWSYVSRNPSLTLEDVLSHPEIEWDWEGVFSNSFQKERDDTFNEILTGELKAVNVTLSFLREEGNFSYATLLLREVVRLHTILLLRRMGASEKIKELL